MHELRGYTLKNERAYKQAKYFWFDSGAACFLAGVHSEKELKRDNFKGRYLENYIFQQIMSWISTQTIKPEIFYWKPKAQQVEVDFILKSSSKVLGIEVKSAVSVSFKDTKSLRAFMKVHPEVDKGVIVYTGKRIFQVATNIYAVPWSVL